MMPSKHWPMAVVLGVMLITLTVSGAWADSESLLPAPGRSWAEVVPLAPGGTTPCAKMMCPCGGAHALSVGTQPIMIEVRLLDAMGLPVAGFPREDILLCFESDDPFHDTIAFCPGENTLSAADADTDAAGMTCFTGALSGRGFLPFGGGGARIYVMLDGVATALRGTSPGGSTGRLPLFFNSADIDGSGVADLADLGAFAMAFGSGGYAFEADLKADGVLNLSDVGAFAAHFGHGCP